MDQPNAPTAHRPRPGACPVLDPTGSDRHGEAARLRQRGPATLVELPGGVHAWSVTSDAVIRKLATDDRVSRDPRRHWPTLKDLPEDWPLRVWTDVESFFTSYGPEHRAGRRRVAGAFSARRVEALRPKVQAIVDRLITGLEQTPPGEVVELREAFAYALPTEVIMDLFGVPPGDIREQARRVLEAALHTAATPEQAQANMADLTACMRTLLEVKRDQPGEDMTTDLLAAGDSGGMSEHEQVSVLILMIGAGSETAVSLILNATHALLTHPAERELLEEGLVTWADVVEETLRLEPSIMHMPLRYAVDDINLDDDVVIRRGEAILLGWGAAGRDPALHGPTADQFDPTRGSKEHLAFGYGVHHCLGAHLGRLEALLALPALFDTFPRLTLAVPAAELPRQESFISNGFSAYPVILRPSDDALGGAAEA